MERGTVTLIGATTENPSFEVNSALLSRVRVFVLQPMAPDDIAGVVRKALADGERGLAKDALTVSDEAVAAIAGAADGDARRALTVLEAAAHHVGLRGTITRRPAR